MNESTVRQFPNRRPQPFDVVYPTNWAGHEPQPVRWLVENCIPRGTVCLFSGDSGLGKSLLAQQLQTCASLKKDWLGFHVEPVRSCGFYCEDPLNVLELRQNDICRHFGGDLSDLEDMSIISRVGMDNILMDFNRRTDEGRVTGLYEQLRSHVVDFGAQLLIVDTLAHTFNGNENIRSHVTAFVSALQRIATEIDGAVVLSSHPSVSSMQSGTGYSGSTAWKATVRAHMYLKRPKGYDDEDDGVDNDARVLKTMKANWGPGGGMTKLRWNEGVFIPLADRAPLKDTLGKYQIEKTILDAMTYLIKRGDRIASGMKARNSAVPMLMGLPSMKTYTRQDIGAAVDRLLEDQKLCIVTFGPPSRAYSFIRPANVRYPSEGGNDGASPSHMPSQTSHTPTSD